MRTLIDIERSDIEKLDLLAARQKRSRAAVIREAVADYLEKEAAAGLDEAFGLWRGRGIDSLEYQKKLREEW